MATVMDPDGWAPFAVGDKVGIDVPRGADRMLVD